jgi:hypothetical protein
MLVFFFKTSEQTWKSLAGDRPFFQDKNARSVQSSTNKAQRTGAGPRTGRSTPAKMEHLAARIIHEQFMNRMIHEPWIMLASRSVCTCPQEDGAVKRATPLGLKKKSYSSKRCNICCLQFSVQTMLRLTKKMINRYTSDQSRQHQSLGQYVQCNRNHTRRNRPSAHHFWTMRPCNVRPCLDKKKLSPKTIISIFAVHVWSIKYRQNKKNSYIVCV